MVEVAALHKSSRGNTFPTGLLDVCLFSAPHVGAAGLKLALSR